MVSFDQESLLTIENMRKMVKNLSVILTEYLEVECVVSYMYEVFFFFPQSICTKVRLIKPSTSYSFEKQAVPFVEKQGLLF